MKKLSSFIPILAIVFAIFTWNIALSASYSQELQEAYDFAYKNKITTQNSIDKADMYWWLTRIAMAKMLSQYAINILWKSPDTSKIPNFWDVNSKLDWDYNNWVTLAYQLWIMWVWIDKFRPYDSVTRAEFWTALSRVLYWDKYEWGSQYYTNHLNALKTAWIMNQIDQPNQWEIRWYVMLMLMRAGENVWNKVSEILNMVNNGDNKISNNKTDKRDTEWNSEQLSNNTNYCKEGSFRIYNYQDDYKEYWRFMNNNGFHDVPFGEETLQYKNLTVEGFPHFVIRLLDWLSWNEISSFKLSKIWNLDDKNIESIELVLFNSAGDTKKYPDSTMLNWEISFKNLHSKDIEYEYWLISVHLKKDIEYDESIQTIWFKIIDIATSNCSIKSEDDRYEVWLKTINFTDYGKITLTVNNSQEEYNSWDLNYREILGMTLDWWEKYWGLPTLEKLSIYNDWNIDLGNYIDDIKIYVDGKERKYVSYENSKKPRINGNMIDISSVTLNSWPAKWKKISIKAVVNEKAVNEWISFSFYIRDESDIIIENWGDIGNIVNIWKEYAKDNKKTAISKKKQAEIENDLSDDGVDDNVKSDSENNLSSEDNNDNNGEILVENNWNKSNGKIWEDDINEENSENWWGISQWDNTWDRPYCVNIDVSSNWKSYSFCLVKWDGSYFHMSVDDAEDLSLCSISKAGNLWESRSCNKTFTMLPASWTVSLQLTIKYNNESYTVQKNYDLDSWVFID